MEGREVFKHAVGMITDVIEDAFKATGTSADDIDWFVPHQANRRIIDASAHKLHIAPQKVVVTVDLHGNTSAASIPLANCIAVADGRVKKGDLVLLEAMASGVPVVSSAVSSLPEVVGDAAILVNPENVFDIARGIKDALLDDAARFRCIQRGYEQARRFSWDRTAAQVLEVYREVAGARS